MKNSKKNMLGVICLLLVNSIVAFDGGGAQAAARQLVPPPLPPRDVQRPVHRPLPPLPQQVAQGPARRQVVPPPLPPRDIQRPVHRPLPPLPQQAAQGPVRRQLLPPPLPPRDEQVERGVQVDCPVCFDEVSEDDCPVLLCGHHKVCKECLQDQVALGLRERSTENLVCSTEDCDEAYTLEDIRAIHDGSQDVVNQFNEVKVLEYLRQAVDIKNCPTPDCQFKFSPGEGRRERVTCPACAQNYCSECLHDHNVQITCQVAREERELAEDPNRADAASRQWLEANAQQCPRCTTQIQRTRGCNHMTCSQCYHEFCWLCLGDFNPNLRFQACGCPLFGGVRR